MSLRLPAPLYAQLWVQAGRAAPQECLGLLAGQGGRVRALYPLHNVSETPQTRYQADALELLRAFRAIDAEGWQLLALYHSHPRGGARPSETDRALASYQVPYLILDVLSGQLRAYLLPSGEEVAVQLDAD